MKRFLLLLLLVPIGIVIIALAVANRQNIELALPPELGIAPFSMPLFALIFTTLIAGMVLGSFATWVKQGKHRKEARVAKVECTKLAFEAEKQKERADDLASETTETSTNERRAFAALGLTGPTANSKAA